MPIINKSSFIRAFTLAEILTVLGIIGIIAAVTIPTLITNYQKEQTVTQLKKIYSQINNAIKIAEVENGLCATWDTPKLNFNKDESITWWNTYFIPYSSFSVTKTCTDANYTECWSSGAKFLDGTAFGNQSYIYQVLADGSFIAYTAISNTGQGQIYIDINGMKKPNIVGRDIFYIVFIIKKGYATFGGYGTNRNSLIYNDNNSYCNTSSGAYKGVNCGTVILKDGWKISDDYPWK